MTRILLIRHAQAEGNLYRRIQGRYDSLLTKLGKKQIEFLRERLLSEKIDAVYSSDLRRAMETAEAAAAPRGLPVIPVPGLREVDLGVWEDRTWGEVEDDDAEQIFLYNSSPDKWSISGGEPFADLQERIASAMRQIASDNEGKTVAVFSHGGAIRAFLAYAQGIPANEIKRVYHCDNTGISTIDVSDGVFTVVSANDNDHLPEEFSTFKRETWWKEESSNDGRNMRFKNYDIMNRENEYLSYYRDAWIIAHGSDEGFSKVYARSARRRAAADPETVAESILLGVPTGLIELAPETSEIPGAGHVAFLYLKPEFRGRMLAAELIGYAVHYYRGRGRTGLTLRVATANTRAVGFYQFLGFEYAGGLEEPRLMYMSI